MMMLAFLLLSLSTVLGLSHSEDVEGYTATVNDGKWSVNKLSKAAASSGLLPMEAPGTAYFSQNEGWRFLTLLGNDTYAYDEQFYGVGVLEGYLTAVEIEEHRLNVLAALFDHNVTEPPAPVSAFLLAQHEWARKEAQKRRGAAASNGKEEDDDFWTMVGGLVQQADGVVEGMLMKIKEYNMYSHDGDNSLEKQILKSLKGRSRQELLADVLYVAGAGDVPMIMSHLNLTTPPDYDHMNQTQIEIEVLKQSRCSALVRVTDDLSDLFAGHSTWWNYGTMLRLYKQTSLPLPPAAAAAKKRASNDVGGNFFGSDSSKMHVESFSSYPGVLSSQDDFYITSRGHIILQTTNSVYNTELYALVHPETLLSWHRVRLANALADTGDAWQQIFRKEASGTYPNQYMIVDAKRFVPGQPLPDGLLTVVEEIPGLIEAADLTQNLAAGYWPSYNVAYFETVYRLSGTEAFVKEHGLEYSYEMSARAQIFRRDAPRVDNYSEFWDLLRSNDFKNDPLAQGNPLHAICGRGDFLDPPQPRGCIDTKITSYARALANQQANIITGPTTGTHHDFNAFSWNEQGGALEYQSHIGVSETFAFNSTCVSLMGVDKGCS